MSVSGKNLLLNPKLVFSTILVVVLTKPDIPIS